MNLPRVSGVSLDFGMTLAIPLKSAERCVSDACEASGRHVSVDIVNRQAPAPEAIRRLMFEAAYKSRSATRRELVQAYGDWMLRLGVPCTEAFALAESALTVFQAADNWSARPGAIELMGMLHSTGRPSVILSNWHDDVTGISERLAIAPTEGCLSSACIGVAKPARAAFEAAARRLGSKPAATLHIGDDPIVDGRGARRAGLQAAVIPVGGAISRQLREELEQLIDPR